MFYSADGIYLYYACLLKNPQTYYICTLYEIYAPSSMFMLRHAMIYTAGSIDHKTHIVATVKPSYYFSQYQAEKIFSRIILLSVFSQA